MKIAFKNKRVLITGGSRGIGAEIAKQFKSLGADLISLSSADYDFTDDNDLNKLQDFISAQDRIDVCVNCAATIFSSQIDKMSTDDYRKLMMVNLEAPFLITKWVSKIMCRHHYGRIVNIGSIAAERTRPNRSAYSASKHALIALTRSSAIDLAPHKVLVNAVSPGFTMTDMVKSSMTDSMIDELSAMVPMGRFASPSDIAKAVLFLASDHNQFITGHNMVVDGGFSHSIHI